MRSNDIVVVTQVSPSRVGPGRRTGPDHWARPGPGGPPGPTLLRVRFTVESTRYGRRFGRFGFLFWLGLDRFFFFVFGFVSTANTGIHRDLFALFQTILYFDKLVIVLADLDLSALNIVSLWDINIMLAFDLRNRLHGHKKDVGKVVDQDLDLGGHAGLQFGFRGQVLNLDNALE